MTMVLAEIRTDFPGFSGNYSEGIASLAAAVRQHGHDFTLVHLTRPIDPIDAVRLIKNTEPDVVGYSCMTHTFRYVQRYAERYRIDSPKVKSIIGGVHAMLRPHECLAVNGIDAVCTGEGEIALPVFLERLQKGEAYTDVAGIWSKINDSIFETMPAEGIMDLDTLPLPDRSVFKSYSLVTAQENVLYACASRGCPFDCAFCCNAAVQKCLHSTIPPIRLKSPARVCSEIEAAEEFRSDSLKGIYFQDDIFPFNKQWLEEFAELYPRRINVPFNCNLRADIVTEDRVRLLRASGCVSVSVGVESGVEKIRSTVLGKDIPNSSFAKAFGILRANDIRINTFSMVGLPGETIDDIFETIHFNASAPVNKAMCSIFFPYFGTALYERCQSDGMLTQTETDTYQETSVIIQKSISRQQTEFLHDMFPILRLLMRKFGERSLPITILTILIRRDGWSISLLLRVYRSLRKTAVVFYLKIGKLFFNRQNKVFG